MSGHGDLYYMPIQHATGVSDWERVDVNKIQVNFQYIAT